MAEDTLTQTPTQDPPLKQLWNSLRKKNTRFQRTYEEFETDMQNEKVRQQLHKTLQDYDPAFSRTYDEFSADMGFVKKKEPTEVAAVAEAPSSPDGSQASQEPMDQGLSQSQPMHPLDETGKIISQNFDPDVARLAQVDPQTITQPPPAEEGFISPSSFEQQRGAMPEKYQAPKLQSWSQQVQGQFAGMPETVPPQPTAAPVQQIQQPVKPVPQQPEIKFKVSGESGAENMHPWAISLGNVLADSIGDDTTFNSIHRTPERNKEVGGKEDSFHLIGAGIDVKPSDWAKISTNVKKEIISAYGAQIIDEGDHIHIEPKSKKILEDFTAQQQPPSEPTHAERINQLIANQNKTPEQLRDEFTQQQNAVGNARATIAQIASRQGPQTSGARIAGDDPGRAITQAVGKFNEAVIKGTTSIPKGIAMVAKPLDDLFGIGKAGRPVEDYETYQLGEWLERKSKEWGLYITDPELDDSFLLSDVPQGFGSVASIILLGGPKGFVGKAPGLAAQGVSRAQAIRQGASNVAESLTSQAAQVGAVQMAVPEYEAAKRAGKSDEEAFKVFAQNYGLGATEVLPIERALNTINKLSGGNLMEIAKAGFAGGLEELIQESVQTTVSNKIAQGSYDPSRDTFQDVIRAGGAGFFVGFVLPGIGVAMQKMTPEQREATKAEINKALKEYNPESNIKAPAGDLGKPQTDESTKQTPAGAAADEQKETPIPKVESTTAERGAPKLDKDDGTAVKDQPVDVRAVEKEPATTPVQAEQPAESSQESEFSRSRRSGKKMWLRDLGKPGDVIENDNGEEFTITKKVDKERYSIKDAAGDEYEITGREDFYLKPKEDAATIQRDSSDAQRSEETGAGITEGKAVLSRPVQQGTDQEPSGQPAEADVHGQYIADVAPRIGKEELNKNSLRKIAEKYGIDNDSQIKELTEVAIVNRAREIVATGKVRELMGAKNNAYEDLVELYKNQPTLSHRTSESIAKQQYSTPVPIGYLAGKYVNADKVNKTFEPSAGNGMLTIVADPSKVTVNEIDDFRGQNLSRQKFSEILKQDGSKPFGRDKEFDAVITNPPFEGTDMQVIDGYKFNEMAQIMAIRALETMKDKGKAAIIIGGHNKFDPEGRLTGRDRIFFNYLYNRYNVDDVIDISGELYRKQGASFPLRLILVNGRKATPSGVAPSKGSFGSVVESFEDLKPRVEKFNTNPDENLQSTELVGRTATASDRTDTGSKSVTKRETSTGSAQEPAATTVSEPGAKSDRGRTEAQPPDIGPPGSAVATGEQPGRDSGIDTELPGVPQPDVEQGQQPGSVETTEPEGPAADVRRDRPGTDRKAVAGALSQQSGSVDYTPASKGKVMKVKIPSSMAQEMYDAMSRLKDQVGDIDEYVQKKLKYKSKKELHEALSAEQIDGVALAIKNIEDGRAVIIGDQTGIGKGRQAAAIIRYGNMIGKKPIFLSEKPNLFGAIYRDLKSIGHGHIKPFIVNNIGDKFNGVRDKDEGGKVIHKAYPSGHKDHVNALKSMQIPNDAQVVLATYSQFGNPKYVDKINFIKAVAQDNIIIMDESHNSSGAESNTGEVFQSVMPEAKGVVFLSGTYAKRPDNMPIYALKTSMSEANMTTDQLIEAVTTGGVALQEIVSSQLADAGELIRRQRSLEDVTVNNDVLSDQGPDHIKSADTITDLIRDIIQFQSRYVKPAIKEMDQAAKDAGEIVKLTGGTNAAGVDNTPYFSKVFNIIDQMLYSLKAKSIADWAIKELKAGRKPFIAIRGTMESNLSDLLESGTEYGDTINADFSFVMEKGLNGVMRYTVKDPMGFGKVKYLLPDELGPSGAAEYQRILQKIKSSVSGLSISPIDEVVQTIEKAGYKVAEVTGRQSKLILSSGKKRVGVLEKKKREPVDEAYRKYNAGDYDVLVVNSSGSTGEDAHADGKFKDKRPRSMVVLQPELNINTLVQILGRINRTGQIHQPSYTFLNSVIPAEQRLMMMTMKKLKSLDANTTSNQKQSKGVLDVPEFFNKYGDQIVIEYLQENPEIIDMLGDPLKMGNNEDLKPSAPESAALRVSGRVAILPAAEQEKFYNEIADRYRKQLEYLDEAGINDLEVTNLPLNAKTIAEKVTVVGKGGKSAFGDDTFLEEVEVDVLKKPLTRADIDEKIKQLSHGDPNYSSKLYEDIQKYEEKVMAEIDAKYDNDLEKALADLEAQEQFQKAVKDGGVLMQAAISDLDKLTGGIISGAKNKKQYTEEERQEAIQATKDTYQWRKENKKRAEQFRIDYVKSLIRFFKPGRAVRIPKKLKDVDITKEKEVTFYSDGIFMGFDINMNKEKPFLPSNIRMYFAVNDSRASIPIPASKNNEINSIREWTANMAPSRVKEVEDWDKLKKPKGREVRLMATGNILQGLGKYGDGKIVKYTTQDGYIKTGILLPEGYEEEESSTTGTVSVPAAKTTNVMKKSSRYSQFTTADGKVTIRNEGGDRYSIRVPKAKIMGGKYYLDSDILDLVDNNNFDSVGNEMQAFTDGNRLTMLMDVLQTKFGASINLNQKTFEKALADKEIEMTKRSAQTFEPMAQLSLFPWLTPSKVKKKPVNQVAEDALRKEIEFKNQEAEERYRDAAGPSPSNASGRWDNIKDAFSHMITGFTSHFRHLNPKKYPREANLLRVFETVKNSTADRTKQYLQGLVEPLTKEQFDIFTRRIVLEDLLGGIDKGLEQPDKLPFGLKSKKEVQLEIDKFKHLMSQEPAAQEAYDQRQAYMDTLYDALVDRGILFGDDDRGTYYHRRVLEYLQEEENQKTLYGKRLSKSYKDWRRARTGTKGKDYSTNFIESEYRVVAEGLYELEKQRILNELMGPYEAALKTLKSKFQKVFQARIEELENQFGKGSPEVQAYKKNKRGMLRSYIEENKPEGYVWYQPTPGNAIFVRKLVSQEAIEKTVEKAGLNDQSGIGTALQLIENIVDMADPYVLVGQKRKEYLIPKDLADQLEDMGTNKQADPNLLQEITSAWKVYVLLNPNRFVKYNMNNFFGDLDGTLAADPSILKKVSQAWKELKEYKQTGKTTPALNEAIRHNVVDSGWELTELSDINNAKWASFFSDQGRPDLQDVYGQKVFRESGQILRSAPGKIWQWYWDKVKGWTRIRENALRYAAYLRAKEKIAAGENFYWASDPKQIDGIKSPEYKAGKLSREVLGDYGNISITGQRIRRYMIPFYAWMEINMGRYYRLFKNASDPRVQARIGAMMAARGVTAIAWRMMWAYGLMGLMTAMIEAWNWFRFPEETEKLMRANARGMQLILGTTDDGKVVTLPIVGAFYDFLDFFGLPDMKDDLALIFSGEAPKKGAMGAAKTFAMAPYAKIVQGVNPFGKMAYELITGDQLFPDPKNPRPIYDYGEYFAQFLSLQDEYRALTGTPTRQPYFFGHMRNMVVKEIDPDELSYFMARRIIQEYQGGGGFEPKHDAKSTALYRYGLAIRFGNTEEALHWMNQYYAAGGTPAGLNQSLRGKNPISRLKATEEQDIRKMIEDPNYQPQTAFGKSLSPKEVLIFRDAMEYYRRTYDPMRKPD